MKKILVIFAILMCCFYSFALENKISLEFTPFEFQGQKTTEVTSEAKESESQWSSYGIGASVTYKFFVLKDLYAELGVDVDVYSYKGEDYKCTNVMGFAGAGYRLNIDEKYSAYAHLSIGADSILKNKVEYKNIVIKLGIGGSYSLSEKFTLDFEIDGTFGFDRKLTSIEENYTKYSTYRIIPYLGATYNFQ